MSRNSKTMARLEKAAAACLNPTTPVFNKFNWIFGLFLVLAIIGVYQPVWHAGFIWDDDAYVTKNPLLTAPDGLKRIWFSLDSPSQYFPLTYTTFRIERTLWGLNPTGYHWVNILLHAINALLVWRLLGRLAVPGAWLAAALFALHPVQVESVAWITERKNVLSLFFFLLSLLFWVQFMEKPSGRPWRHYGLALFFYALALFSKTTACTLPAALLLILWLKSKPIDRQRLIQIVPFMVLGLAMGLVTMWWERFHQGTQGKLFSMSLVERLLMASHALWFYAGKLFWPSNLTFIYPRWVIEPADPTAYVWPAMGIGLCAAICFARRFAGRSVEVATLYYVAMLSPLLGFIMLYTFRYTFVADHYQYVASIGLIALIAAGIAMTFKTRPLLKLAVSGALLLTLGILTRQQAEIYRDTETLWRDTLVKNPDCWLASTSLGGILINQGRIDEGMEYCLKAVQMNPNFSESLNNLGVAFADKGQFDKAIENYHKAIQINPDFAESLNNLGVALAAKGRPDEAIENYRKAIKINPNYCDALDNLGITLTSQGRFNEAIQSYHQAIETDSKRPETFYHLGLTLYQMGHSQEAIATYREALRLNPNLPGALNNLAWMLATSPNDKLRNGDEAIRLAKHACGMTHYEQPVFIGTMAAAYAEAGRFEEATAASKKAFDLAQFLGQQILALKEQKLMQLFQTRQPYREQPDTTSGQ
jgi:tetratricopeptide (TPR) repeat protein